MAWFEVSVTASQLIAIEAESQENALMIAMDESFLMADGCDKTIHAVNEMSENDDIESLKRHADLVYPMDVDAA